VLRLPVAARRRNPAGGVVVAFLGPDGCGKSTLARETRQWLGWKLDVHSVYFGSGDGPVSLQRWPLKLMRGLHRRLRPRVAPPAPESRVAGRRVGIARLRWVWAISLALEKRARMRSVVRARNRGMAVVCDRYPQIQVMEFNDGPLLAAWLDHSRFWRRRLARWELEVYRAATRTAPDLAFKLSVDADVARQRKPEVSAAEVRRRLSALARIDYGPSCRIVEVDASRPLDRVLADVKRNVWRCL
jgi:thymidylate kinase